MTAAPTPKPRKPFWRRWWFIALTAIAVVGIIGNLTGGGAPTPPAAAPSPEATTRTPQAAASPSATTLACHAVPADTSKTIIEDVKGAKITASSAVTDGVEWLVAIRFDAAGAPASEGVWLTRGIDPIEGPVYSTEGVSHNFTQWPQRPGYDVTHSGVEAAFACLRQR